jgi:hypothetical protein
MCNWCRGDLVVKMAASLLFCHMPLEGRAKLPPSSNFLAAALLTSYFAIVNTTTLATTFLRVFNLHFDLDTLPQSA